MHEQFGNGDINLKQIWGGEHPADVWTKIVDRNTIERLMRVFGIRYLQDRDYSAPAIANECVVVSIVPKRRW